MNIKQAKNEIQNAMKAYFSKDKFGNYVIPLEKQRPVFLMGPPGIGKTAIMGQVAAELGVSLVSYSMTHHTRQSAIGLPFIEKKEYGGKEYNVSKYTMSEIIASVYDMIEKTGNPEGILFLDEVNCVSETLAPAMLQFLQYKVFARHRIPDGWIVVTAGNPPEYNNSVREFDIVTWDRLKRIDVEPDYDAWKEHAYRSGVHASIITYLDVKKNNFYKIETTVYGKSFVTARGWSDLSDMIILYEKNDIPVTESLVAQYLQNNKIAKDFAVYYDLFKKYKSDYQIDSILNGSSDKSIKQRAKDAQFDERFCLIGLIIDAVTNEMKEVCEATDYLTELMRPLKKAAQLKNVEEFPEFLSSSIDGYESDIETGLESSSISKDEEIKYRDCIEELKKMQTIFDENNPGSAKAAFELLKKEFNSLTNKLTEQTNEVGEKLSNVFSFFEEVFGEGQEILIFITELTAGYYSSRFISRYGCEEYFKYNKDMLFYERQQEIIEKIDELSL